MESNPTDLRSSVKHFRTTYLFLGVYLIAKTEMRTRWESSITNASDNRHRKKIKQKDFRKSFSRMEIYFEKQINDFQKSLTDFVNEIFTTLHLLTI